MSCGTVTTCWALATNSDGSATTESWEGQYWEGDYEPVIPSGGSAVTLNGISCTAATTCTAVGSYVKAGKTLPLVERLKEYEWSLQSAATTSSASLKDVSCVSASECVAIGYGEGKLIAERWNGTAWSVLPAPPNPSSKYPTSTTLTDLSCASSSSCMAIGYYYIDGKEVEEEILKVRLWFAVSWNGSIWSAAGQGTEAAESPNDVVCTTATNCIAVGTKGTKTLAQAWDGSKWSAQSPYNPEGKTPYLSAISCSATAACTAVGRSTGGGETVSLAERWNGTSWSPQTTLNPAPPKTSVEFTDVACRSATACLAVGYDNANGRGLGERWNGSQWVTGIGSLPSGRRPKAVSCGTVTTCWALATNSDGSATTESWEGQYWEGDYEPVIPSGGSAVTLNGISCTAATTCTAVGSYVKAGKTLPLVERLKEYEWSLQSAATTSSASLKDVSCVSASECVAIGYGEGKLIAERWNGTAWSVLPAPPNPSSKYPTSTTLTDLSCASSSSCMAIGYYYIDGKEVEEEILKVRLWFAVSWNGSIWSAAGQGTEAAESPNDVVCTTATNCIAVGTKGTKTLAQAWDGSKWSAQSPYNPEGKTPYLSAISCSATAACTAVGRSTGGGETVSLAERTILRPEPAPEEDPKVEVDTSAGLVTSVEGDGVEEITYAHKGQMLTAVDSPDGETKYEYDTAERLTKVTLPNGTWGKVEYEAAGRVKSVSVSIKGGKAKATAFSYQDEPSRRTTITPEGEPSITYDIGADGSVLKWRNAVKPPEIEQLTGSLWVQRGEVHPEPITIGDHTILVQAHSVEGIASIQVIANSDQVVAEKTCEQDLGKAGTECVNVAREYVTNTENWAPGIVTLEILVTDRLNQVASQQFWVNIPYTPPPESEAANPPTFADVLNFREDYGLDVDLQGNEFAINERIFDLIGDWHNPNTPNGGVARATMEQWGVPLRPADVAEFEYRERYLAQAASLMPAWAASNAPGTYAGLYMDHRAGGIVRVGFTANQVSAVLQLKVSGGLMAPGRVGAFPYQPVHTLASLEGSLGTASQAVAESSAPPGIVSVDVDIPSNGLRLGTTEVAATKAFAEEALGGATGVVVEAKSPPEEFAGRFKAGAPFLAATILRNVETACTAGYGAWSKVGKKPNGDPLRHRYVLTAGHCFPGPSENAASIVSRMRTENDPEGVEIGKVERRHYSEDPKVRMTDAEVLPVAYTQY